MLVNSRNTPKLTNSNTIQLHLQAIGIGTKHLEKLTHNKTDYICNFNLLTIRKILT